MGASTDLLRLGFYGSPTTLSGAISNTATTIPLSSTTGLPTSTGIDLVIDRVSPSGAKTPGLQETVTVLISGSNGTNAIRGVEGVQQAHANGAVVEVLFTAATHNAHINHNLTQHTQTGAHIGVTNTGGMTTDTLLVTSGSTLPNNDIQANELATNAITLGFASVTANQTGVTATSATQVTGLSASVTVPAGGRRLEVVAHLPAIGSSGTGTMTAYVSLWDGSVGTGSQLQEDPITLNANSFLAPITIVAYPTPSAGAKVYNVGVRVSSMSVALNFASSAPGTLIVKAI